MSKRAVQLQFTEEELLSEPVRKASQKAEAATRKLEKTESALPRKTILTKKRVVDPGTGKVTTRLFFEEVDKKQPSKLREAVQTTPGKVTAASAHRLVHENEQDNIGVEGAHKSEETIGGGVRIVESAHRSSGQRQQQRISHAEAKADRANVNALYQDAKAQAPEFSSNPYSRWQQKRHIKQEYAAAKAGRTSTATVNASETVSKANEATQKTVERIKRIGRYIKNHKTGLLILGCGIIAVMLILQAASSLTLLLNSNFSTAMGTYPAEDADLYAAEAAYCAKEDALQTTLDEYEATHSYDEYIYDLDEIGHDPYVLMSAITALMGDEWTIDDVGEILDLLFEQQYVLTEEVTSEIRYETETRTAIDLYHDADGNLVAEEYEYEVDVPYTYYICTVTLENRDLSHVPALVMTEEQLGWYAVYMSTLGNRPDLWPSAESVSVQTSAYLDYDISEAAMADETFAAMMAEATKYLGYPYVYGGSSPSTSFDCSGFVCWVLNHCGVGWNVGRTTAQGLSNYCTLFTNRASAKPGDLVFFEGTYDFYETITHVGIYVGDGMILHCGNPIQYTSIDTVWWTEHFYAYGRLYQP